MAKPAIHRKYSKQPTPQLHKVPQNNYSRKAFNNLNKVQAQSVSFSGILTILQKFTKRHFIEVATFILISFLIKAVFIGVLTLDSIKESSNGLFFSTIGAAFLSNIVIASIGFYLSKKLLLSHEEWRYIPSLQGALRFVGFAFIMSFISLLLGFGIQMIAGSYQGVASSIIAFIGTLLAAGLTAMVIIQYGLILPAAAANRKHSMSIACAQIRPFWKSLFVPIFSCKAIMAFFIFFISLLPSQSIVSSLVVGLLSSVFSLYIYLALSASYAAAGYLFNTDYDVQKDDFK